jgi:hypothetical protein
MTVGRISVKKVIVAAITVVGDEAIKKKSSAVKLSVPPVGDPGDIAEIPIR